MIENIGFYTPLQQPTTQIRLLHLYPGQHGCSVEGELETISLNASPQYDALSYTWGNPEDTVTATLNGRPRSITRNLHDALVRLRDSGSGRVLWADAVCIDQSNDVEKSQQVHLMPNIYAQASRVFVWLGAEGDNSDLAMELIAKMDDVDFRSLDQETQAPPEWEALSKLFARSWWSRVWIVQEIALGERDPIILCGQRELPWSAFKSAKEKLRIEYVRPLGWIARHLTQNWFGYLDEMRSITQRQKPWPLTALLSFFRNRGATDHRDKVYGILGIAPRTAQENITVDYGRHKLAMHVYADVVDYAAKWEYKLNVLCQADHFRWDEYPSWLPDWSRRAERETLVPSNYEASRQRMPVARVSDDRKVLTVRGVVVDTVIAVSDVVCNGENLLQTLTDMETVAQAVCGVDDERFWRSILANINPVTGEGPAPDSFAHSFKLFRHHLNGPHAFESTAVMVPEEQRVGESEAEWLLNFIKPFTFAFGAVLAHRRLLVTERGRLGIGWQEAQADDLVCVLYGGDMPFLLRAENEYYRCIGPTYVHGIMNGEALQDNGIEPIDFDIR